MRCQRSNTTMMVVCLAMLLPACQGGKVDAIQASQAELSEQVALIDARLQTLEKRPRLDFTLIDTHTAINEKMFEPQLESSAQLSVKGDNVPPTFYVDVMLKVEVPDIQYVGVERQIFPVVDGKGKLQMLQRLPQHGLKPEQIQVTLKPMTWYRGQIISDDMVRYQ